MATPGVGLSLVGNPTLETNRPENPTRTQQGSLFGQWNDWVNKPGNSAAMIQAGLNLLQPMAPGQTFLGHLAQGVGSGFEAHDRALQTADELEKQDLELKAKNAEIEQTRAQTGLASAQTGYYQQRGPGGAGSTTLQSTLARLDDTARARWLKFFAERTDPLLGDIDANDPEAVSSLYQQWQAAESAYSGAGNAAAPVAPPPNAIAALKANPKLASDFDTKYGVGSAARILTGG